MCTIGGEFKALKLKNALFLFVGFFSDFFFFLLFFLTLWKFNTGILVPDY